MFHVEHTDLLMGSTRIGKGSILVLFTYNHLSIVLLRAVISAVPKTFQVYDKASNGDKTQCLRDPGIPECKRGNVGRSDLQNSAASGIYMGIGSPFISSLGFRNE